jgi:uncharacterized protein
MKKSFPPIAWTAMIILLSITVHAKIYRYISIDAGGMLGLIPAQLLSDIEEKTERPIYQLIDGMIGTSTGSIISALLSTPSKSGKPHSGSEIANFYETHGADIFSTIRESYINNSIRKLFHIEPNYSKANKKYEFYAGPLWKDFKFSDALIKLSILALDATSFEPYIFYSDHPNHQNILIRQAVKGSVAIADVFGTIEIKLPFEGSKIFIDAGNESTGKPAINDPTPYLYQQLKLTLSPKDKAIIYSLGTGYAPTSKKTKDLMKWQEENRDTNISIIRIQPKIEALSGDSDGMWTSLLAADASPEAINNMNDEAYRLMGSREYQSMLSDLKIAAK